MNTARPNDLADRYRVAGQASAEAANAQDSPGSTAAFFDVDNTIMRGASIFHLARGLASRRFFSANEVVDFVWKQTKFVTSGAENMNDMASVTESALSFVKGRRVSEVVELGTTIFDEVMVNKMWPGTLGLAQQHLDDGDQVWLVTAAPMELATIIAQRLGFTGALGTVSEIIDGRYTGKLVGNPLHGPAKATAVEALAARTGLDLQASSAYSDSFNDLPMLNLVGHPNAVNPDSALRSYSRDHQWPIHDYRRERLERRSAVAGGVLASGALVAGVGIGLALAHRSRRNA